MSKRGQSPVVESPDRAVARIDVSCIERNCARLSERIGEGAELCAVVKADGYGHGDIWCSKAAVAGGASWLAVATAEEAVEIRRHHELQPLLVMGALTSDGIGTVLGVAADLVVWSGEFLQSVISRASDFQIKARVHVKMDSGMGRLGESDPGRVKDLARIAAESEHVDLVGLMTHFATADEPDDDFLTVQLGRFQPVAQAIKEGNPKCIVHAANSAATLREPESLFDMVRCGISVYGLDPFNEDPKTHGLEPALSLESYVAQVKRIDAGESVGYGRKWRAERPTWIANLPIGYGDGVRRGLSGKGEVLIRGSRYRIAGTVSMDNISVELGDETDVCVGDTATLIGSQGGERILAEEMARKLDTINYEITCGISPRVRRVFHKDQEEIEPAGSTAA